MYLVDKNLNLVIVRGFLKFLYVKFCNNVLVGFLKEIIKNLF